MLHSVKRPTDVVPIPLETAMLCVDCESISPIHYDECPICGGHSLLGLSRMLGGPLASHKAVGCKSAGEVVLFDIDINIKVKRTNAAEFSSVVGAITSVIAPTLGRDRASFHVDVEPVIERRLDFELKTA